MSGLPVALYGPKILRPVDRRDVPNMNSLEQLPNHNHVLETGDADLQPVRSGSAVADQVVTHLTSRRLRPRVDLPRWDPRLRTQLESHRPRWNRLEGLPDYLHRLPHLQ